MQFADDLKSFRRAIEQINAEAPEAIRRQDAAALAAWFASDAKMFLNGLPPIEGQAAIQQFYEECFGPPMHLRDASFQALEHEAVGEWAFETGANTLTLQPPGHREPIIVPGKYLVVWRWEVGGSWRIWRYAPSTDATPA